MRKRVCGKSWVLLDTIMIPGEPIAKGRPRVTSTHTYTPKKTKDAQRHIVKHIKEKCANRKDWPFEYANPIYLEMYFYHKRPQRLLRKKDTSLTIPKETKPDLDNLIKLIKDALNDSGYWADDKHNTTILADKMYVAKGEEPRTDIFIYIQED
tara:strand:+ start:4787 stop:5245 length:459 start_codon:yes stop_codon:yes gene_type:complete